MLPSSFVAVVARWSAGGWVWGCLLLAGLPTCLAADGPEPVRVLLIGKNPDHPHGSHMYLHTCRVLAACLEKQPNLSAAVSNGWPAEAQTLDQVDVLVVYTNPAAEFLLDGPQREQVAALMQRGVGLVTLHWASSIFQKDLDRLGPTWLSYLGGTWVSNVGLSSGKSPLKQLVPDHPICRGWQPYEIEDEYYLNPTIDKATPLLEVTEKKGQPVMVGWVFERPGGGRSFATTLGHPYSNFQREPFRRMVVNAILWAGHREVPSSGAQVQVDEKLLALPPKEETNPKK